MASPNRVALTFLMIAAIAQASCVGSPGGDVCVETKADDAAALLQARVNVQHETGANEGRGSADSTPVAASQGAEIGEPEDLKGEPASKDADEQDEQSEVPDEEGTLLYEESAESGEDEEVNESGEEDEVMDEESSDTEVEDEEDEGTEDEYQEEDEDEGVETDDEKLKADVTGDEEGTVQSDDSGEGEEDEEESESEDDNEVMDKDVAETEGEKQKNELTEDDSQEEEEEFHESNADSKPEADEPEEDADEIQEVEDAADADSDDEADTGAQLSQLETEGEEEDEDKAEESQEDGLSEETERAEVEELSSRRRRGRRGRRSPARRRWRRRPSARRRRSRRVRRDTRRRRSILRRISKGVKKVAKRVKNRVNKVKKAVKKVAKKAKGVTAAFRKRAYKGITAAVGKAFPKCLRAGVSTCIGWPSRAHIKKRANALEKGWLEVQKFFTMEQMHKWKNVIDAKKMSCKRKSSIRFPAKLKLNSFPPKMVVNKLPKCKEIRGLNEAGLSEVMNEWKDKEAKIYQAFASKLPDVDAKLLEVSEAERANGTQCKLDIGIYFGIGAGVAAGVSTAVNAGLVLGCDGSKIIFKPFWGWFAGLKSNAGVDAGFILGYARPWSEMFGDSMVWGAGAGLPPPAPDVAGVGVSLSSTIPEMGFEKRTAKWCVLKKCISVPGIPKMKHFKAPKYTGFEFGVTAGVGVLPMDIQIGIAETVELKLKK